MQGQLRHLVCVATLVSLWIFSPTAQADGAGAISPFPISGAYTAEFREDRDHISVIEFSGNYDEERDTGEGNAEARAVVAREFFRTHPDNYDFLVAFSTFEFDTGDALAFHWPVQNKVKGIGAKQFDVTRLFGSDGKLQGYVDMAALSRWVMDPMDPDFEKVLATLSHEVLHQWGPSVRFRNPDGSLSGALLGKDGAHWSYLLDSDASVEYGSDWRDNGDGTFTAVGTMTFYSPLDLYLMGLYRPDEVPPMTLIQNPGVDSTGLPEQGATVAGTARTVTIKDIIAAEGPRIPDAEHSQKHFRMAFLLLTGPGEKVSDQTILGLNNVRQAFMTRFSVLTAGRAEAEIYPEAAPVYQAGSPSTVSGGDLRSGAADLEAAIQWLRGAQTAEGFWEDKPATRVRDTAVTLEVLSKYDGGYGGLPLGAGWLAAAELSNSDYAFRAQSVLAAQGTSSSVSPAQLAQLQNADGGWGVAAGYASDPLDTALAVAALAHEGSTAAVQKGVDYLISVQNEDGGWSGASGGPSRIGVTAEVVRALKAAGGQDLPTLDKTLSWVASKQNGDGGFGDGKSTIHQTASLLIALTDYGALDRIESEQAGQYLLERQTVDGSWAGSTYATALAVAALKNFNLSNWNLESIAALPFEARDGERVRITATLRNDSAAATPGGTVRFYAGDPDAGGVAIGPDQAVPPMAAGSALSFSVVWDSFGKPGTQTFFALVDPGESVVETTERDNRRSIQVSVAPAPASADLEITDADITFMPAHPNRLPTTLGVNANLRNLGLQDARDVRVLLWDGEAGTGTLVGETTLDVANRTTVVANFSYELTRAGVTRLTIQLDPDNTVSEAREDNNIASAEVVLDPSVDLSVAAEDLSLEPEAPQLGDDLAFSVKLHNKGTVRSSAATVRYLLTDATGVHELLSNSVDIGPGETITQSIPARALRAGPATFSVELDGEGLVAELDETNNSASIPFEVADAEGPNLVVGHSHFRFEPNPAFEAGPVDLIGIVRNAGTRDALDVAVIFSDGDPQQGGKVLDRQIFPKIAAGAEVEVSYRWERVPDSADRLMFLVADPDNTILEYDEGDNRTFNTLNVMSLPDLAISSADIELTPTHPRIGEPVSIAARIANVGQQDAENVLVRAYDADPAAGGALIGERTIAALPAGGGATVHFSITFASERTDRPIVVQVDPEGRIQETNRENNAAETGVTVQSGDVYVTNRYFSPNGDGVKDGTELVFRLAQPASVSVDVVGADGNIVRSIPGPSPEAAVTEGTVAWDGMNDHGQVVADGDYILRLMDENGAIAEATATLDTNRSSVLHAIADGDARYENLTCRIAEKNLILFDGAADVGFFPKDGAIFKLETASGAVSKVTDLGAPGTLMAVAADGSRVFFTRPSATGAVLWAVDADGKNLLRLGDVSSGVESLSIAGEGDYVVAVDTSNRSVIRYSTDGFGAPLELITGYWNPPWYGQAVQIGPKAAAMMDYNISFFVDIYTGQTTPALDEPESNPWGLPWFFLADDLPNELKWSEDGTKLAASIWGTYSSSPKSATVIFGKDGEYLAGFEAQPAPYKFQYYSFAYGWNYIDWLSGDALYGLDGDGAAYILHLDGSRESFPLAFQSVVVEPGQRMILGRAYPYQSGDTTVVSLDDFTNTFPVTLQMPLLAGDPWFTPKGDLLYRGGNADPQCAPRGYREYDVIRVRSTLNLIAGFETERSGGRLRFKGTASDKHFKNYVLEYAKTESPDAWNPVAPASDVPVIDGDLGYWIPPGQGNYLVRLTVNDLAGNTRSVIKRVYWGEPVSITDLYTDPAVFSPNGDGILDVSRIHYRVLEPVHLELSLYDAAGDRVRSWVRDHAEVGSEQDIHWEGLDEYGNLLPDGDYTLKVQGYTLGLTIDTVKPVASIAPRNAYQFGENEIGRWVVVAPGLRWQASDPHLNSANVQVEDAGTGEWKTVFSSSIRGSSVSDQQPLSLEHLTNDHFGLVAVDTAGNSDHVEAEPAAEQLIVSGFGNLALKDGVASLGTEECSQPLAVAVAETRKARWHPMGDTSVSEDETTAVVEPGDLKIDVAESIRSTVVQMFVQYREAGSTQWIDEPVKDYLLGFDPCAWHAGETDYFETRASAPDGEMEARWTPAATLKPNVGYILRLVAVDAEGNSHESNAIRFYVSPFRLEGLVRELRGQDKEPAVKKVVAKLSPPWDGAEELLWGQQSLGENVGEIRLYLQSDEDPRYASPRLADTQENPGEIFVLREADLRSCTTYTARAEAYDGGSLFSDPVHLATSTLTFRLPCFEVEAEVKPVLAQACDDPAPAQVEVLLTPMASDGNLLKLLTLSRRRADGTEDVLFNVNQPQSGRQYEYLIDTASLPEGRLSMTATLINVDDEVVKTPVDVVVDHTPAQVDVTYPLEGQRVCGVPYKGKDGVTRNVLTMGADIAESNRFHYSVEADGETIESLGLDSFSAVDGDSGILDPKRSELYRDGPFSGPIAKLWDRNGEVSTQVKVFDTSGSLQCVTRTFYFDGAVDGAGLEGSRQFISPALEGESSALTVTYRTGESSTVDVAVYPATLTDAVYERTGPSVRALITARPALPGANSVVWDGRDDAGSVVPDGSYVVVASFEDACGNRDERQIGVQIDTTPPQIGITSPDSAEPLPMLVELLGYVRDENLTAYNLDYGAGTSPQTWSPMGGGNVEPGDGILGRWNTYGLLGTYTVRLSARDAAGNTATVMRGYTAPKRVDLVSALEVTPEIFSPNGDGRADKAVVNVGLASPADVTVTVTAADATLVRTFDAVEASAGLSLAWDGLDDDGQAVDDGTYRINLIAAASGNPDEVQRESVSVVADNTAPALAISSPANGFATSAVGVSGSIQDDNLVAYTIALTDTPDSPSWREIASGSESRTEAVLASLSDLAEGEFAVRISAEDRAGNSAEQVILFGLDNMPPQVRLLAPANDAVLDASEPLHAVSGGAVEAHPAYYTLSIGEGGNPASWTEIARGPGLPAEPIASLASAELAEQTYSLKLTVVDRAGNRGEDSAVFTLDGTPPQVTLLGPVEGSVITGPVSVVGTVTDANIREYRLYLAPGRGESATRWEELDSGNTQVVAQQLHNWQALPADGQYTLKLAATDAAGHTAETAIGVVISLEPPEPPTALTATLENSGDAHLSWVASTSSDVAGYHVYRGYERLTTTPVANTQYVDAGLAEGHYTYRVRAVDLAGNYSAYADPADLTVDLTAPTVSLDWPGDGAVVGGTIDIRGTADSSDFKEYRLYVGAGAQPQQWTLLRRSPLPVSGGALGQWNTSGLQEGAVYTLRLDAEDISGNVGSVRVGVSIDNLAPAAPTGLVALESGADVNLAWNANGESDLLGYLVFRNGQLIDGEGAGLDLRPYAIANINYADLSVADGLYDYAVAAIDTAGNVSGLSLPAKVSIDTHPPHAVIASPADGAAFDWPLYVLARSEDSDVAAVAFQYRAEGEAQWHGRETDSGAPFETTFDPKALGLTYGNYELRAIATDLSDRTDPSPVSITVTYRDLTRPAAVVGVSASVQGGDVILSWSANGEDDLAGYSIYRRSADGGEFVRINDEPITTAGYTLTETQDGDYTYYVTAVDTSANESDVSGEVSALVYTPALLQPYTPTLEGSVAVVGHSITGGTLTAEITSPAGTRALPGREILQGEEFSLDMVLEEGTNTLTVRVRDAVGNVSRPASVSVLRGTAPARPTGLAGTAIGYQVDLAWDANPEGDIAGYRVFRDGTELTSNVEVTGLSATASNNIAQAAALFASPYNAWKVDTSVPISGQWLAVHWSEAKLVSSLQVKWATYFPGAYDIEAWNGAVWVPLKRITGNDQATNDTELPALYPTDAIRIVVRDTQAPNVFALADVGVHALELDATTGYSESRPDGLFTYTVSAVNGLGFESLPSEPVQVAVGDVVAPEPVQLDATVSGSDVQLSWSPSVSSDVVRYDLYRDGEAIARISDPAALSYVDAGLLNGTYVYTIRAVDDAGNESADSSELSVLVDVALLPAPQAVTAESQPDGDVALSWEAAPGSAPSAYRLLRSTTLDGPYSAVWEGESTSYTDTQTVPGGMYYYVVVALDEAGNASEYSEAVSAASTDLLAPAAPVITYPVAGVEPLETEEPAVSLGGHSEPGSRVSLERNGAIAGTTTALAQKAVAGCAVPDAKEAVMLSPDGRYAAYSTPTAIHLCGIAEGASQALIPGSSLTFMHWMPDGSGFVYASGTTVRRYTLATGESDSLMNSATAGWLSPDGSKLFYLGSGYWGWGKVYDLGTGQTVSVTSPNGIYEQTVRWSPDGRHIAFSRWGTYELVDAVTGTGIQIGYGMGVPQWADGGATLLLSENGEITRYTVADGAKATVVTVADRSASAPLLSPDANELAYVLDNRELWLMNLTTGAQSLVHSGGYVDQWFVQWVDSGDIAFASGGLFNRLSLPGQFRFEGVSLEPGDNLFTASARDDAGNTSSASNEVLVRRIRVEPQLPDLAVEPAKIAVAPSPIAGQASRITVVVDNIGSASSANTDFSALMVAEDGSAVPLLKGEALAGVAPGASRPVVFEWTAQQPGKYTLVVLVDEQNAVEELDELNNVAVRDIIVANDDGPQLRLGLDNDHYDAYSDVALTTAWTVYGADFSGRIEVTIADENGYPVTEVRNMPVSSAGNEVTHEDVWNAGTTFSGTYVARARLLSAEGAVLAQDSATFAIVPSASVDIGVGSDQATYGAHAPVRLTGTLAYTSGNRVLSDAEARLWVSAADGTVLAQSLNRLGNLLPGVGSDLVLEWNTDTRAPGIYTAHAELSVAGETFASAADSFEILPDATHVTGALDVAEEVVRIGDEISVRYRLSNDGNVDVAGLPLRIVLLDPSGPELAAVSRVVDVPMGAPVDGEANFSSESLDLQSYSVVLQQGADHVVLAQGRVTIADLTPPDVQIVAPEQDGYAGPQGQVSIHAADAHSRIKQVEFRIDAGQWLAAPLRGGDAGLYGRVLPELAEGSHSLEARAEDEAGNLRRVGPRSFIMDGTAPEISIAGVEEGGYYNVDVVPQVTVADVSLADQRVTLDGESFSAGSSVGAEGEHTLRVYAEDMAGNVAEKSLTFTIDKTPPEVTIGGVEAGGFYNHEVLPVVEVADAHPGDLNLTLDGAPYQADTPIAAEGIHRFEATATDRAGNSATASVEFTIDTTPPVITIAYPENELTTRDRSIRIEGTTEAIAAVLLDSGALSASALADLDGRFRFADVPLVIGRNAIALTATDRAGNVGEPTVLYINVLPPVELEGYVGAPRTVLVWAPTSGTGSDDVPASESIGFIEATLVDKGFAYRITYSEADFVDALRTQRFTTVVILEPHRTGTTCTGERTGRLAKGAGAEACADPQLKVSGRLDAELRLMTASGTGIVWVKTQPDASEHWDDLFGIHALGSIPRLSAVDLSGDTLGHEGQWDVDGGGLKVRVTDGLAVGSLLPADNAPAMVLNGYGEGTGALVAFDPAAMGDVDTAKAIVSRLIDRLRPSRSRLLPGGYARIDWVATEVDPPLDVQLDEHLASGMRFLDVGDGTPLSDRDAMWQRTIREPESDPFTALVKLGDTVGIYPVRATVSLLIDGVPSYPEEEYLTLEVSDDAASLRAAVLTRLESLAVAPQDERRLWNAIAGVRAALDENPDSRDGAARAIEHLLDAESELTAMSRPYRQVEAALGALLRTYQIRVSDQ